jgi:L-alanine-DL-glutamate epimerase-like enolase superfamily enzyme
MPFMHNNARAKTNPSYMDRRGFLRKLGATAGAAGFTGIMGPFEFAKAAIDPGENGIYITNIYRTRISGLGSYIVRVETNKGIVGYGECRDLDDQALQWLNTLTPYVIGMNPTQIENVFNTMAQQWSIPANMLYNQERMGTGAISAIEMACWDIVGKVYNVPVYKLLGPTYQYKIPMYADTDNNSHSAVVSRVEKGFKIFKCDMYLSNIAQGEVSNSPTPNEYGYYGKVISENGLEKMHQYMEKYRDTLKEFGEPYASAPISSDHYQGYNASLQNQLTIESAIALANTLAAHNMGGWIEDIIDWWIDGGSGRPIQEVTDATSYEAVICTGEDMFGFDQFKTLADIGAVRLFHPEANTAGGLNQTLLAAKYGHERGIRTILHNSSGPIAMTAYAHLAAAIPEFVAMEYHQMNTSWHDDLIDGIEKPMIQDGMMSVPEGPGLGITPNAEQFAAHGAGTWTKIG